MALLEKVALDYLLTLLAGEKAATIPLPIREIAFAKLRADEKKLAKQVAEAAEAAGARPAPAAARRRRCPPAVSEPALTATPAPAPPGDQRYAISEYPDVDAVYAGLDKLVRQPLRKIAPAAMKEYLDYFETKCTRSKAAHRRGQRVHPRRRAAQPGLQLSVPARHREGRGRLPVGRGRQPLHRLPAGRRPDRAGQQLRAGAREGHRAAAGVRPGHRPVPRVRAQAGRAGQPPHAVDRDVPHAGLGHRGRHGRHPRGAHATRRRRRHQDRAAPTTAGATRWSTACTSPAPGASRPRASPGRDRPHPGGLSERPRGAAPQAHREPAAGRHGGGHRRAGRPGERHAARALRLQRAECASCATSSARC